MLTQVITLVKGLQFNNNDVYGNHVFLVSDKGFRFMPMACKEFFKIYPEFSQEQISLIFIT